MTICYYPPTKQEVLIPEVTNNDVKLYSSTLPVLIAPAIIVLNNMLKITISIGWAMVVLSLILALVKFAKSKNGDELIGELKRLSCAALLMWMIPYIPMFMDAIVDTVGDVAMRSIGVIGSII